MGLNFTKKLNWLWGLMILLSSSARAQVSVGHGGGETFGTVATNLTGATDVFSGVFSAMFYVIGIAMVVASIMRYRDHRQNPVQMPIGRVIFLLIAGLIVGFFPFIVNYINASIAHSPSIFSN